MFGHLKPATFVGTPAYATPEMLENSISGDFSDLWSLGVIIYQMLEGKTPWTKESEVDVFDQIINT
jgi:serine/threonine protein kinase